MDKNTAYYEQKHHGDADFAFNLYPCSIPVDFPQVVLHWQDSMELVYIKKGRGIVQAGTRSMGAAAGDIFVFAPGAVHGIRQAADWVMEYENIIFSLNLLSGSDLCTERYILPLQAGRLALPHRLRSGDEGFGQAESCLKDLEEVSRSRLPGYELAVRGILLRFLAGLIALQDVPLPAADSADTRRLKSVLSFIDERYADPLTVAEAAAHCGCSASHFMRWFKQMTGTTFVAHLNEHRLCAAAEELRRSDATVLTIAEQTGFENLSYFNRQFKKRFGMTPRQYREHR